LRIFCWTLDASRICGGKQPGTPVKACRKESAHGDMALYMHSGRSGDGSGRMVLESEGGHIQYTTDVRIVGERCSKTDGPPGEQRRCAGGDNPSSGKTAEGSGVCIVQQDGDQGYNFDKDSL